MNQKILPIYCFFICLLLLTGCTRKNLEEVKDTKDTTIESPPVEEVVLPENPCDDCNGTGKCPECKGAMKCSDCGGCGFVTKTETSYKGSLTFKYGCITCNDSGRCQKCGGNGQCKTCDGTGDKEIALAKAERLRIEQEKKKRAQEETRREQEEKEREQQRLEEIERLRICDSCSGTGICHLCNGSKVCNSCNGTGQENLGSYFNIPQTCSSCNGDGICHNCNGSAFCPMCQGTGGTDGTGILGENYQGSSAPDQNHVIADGEGQSNTEQHDGESSSVPTSSENPTGEKKECPTCLGIGSCGVCSGTGICTYCLGSGKTENGASYFNLSVTCNKCNGTGGCSTCGGNGTCHTCNGIGYLS